MQFHKTLSLFVVALLLLTACSQQKARNPISQSSGSFMKESIDRNKKLVAGEELKIDALIKQDTANKYIASSKGYWYRYDQKNSNDTLRPKKGDVAHFTYEIKDLDGNVVYSELELRPQTYRVDKEQKMIIGLRHGLKLMHKNEKVTFLFPSHLAYGYHGDNRRIRQNVPLIYTVSLTDFSPENSSTTNEQ